MKFSRIDLTGEKDYLTIGETWFLRRRRLGLSQLDFASTVKWPISYVKQLEADELDLIKPGVKAPLKSYERCVIYRRRTKQTQRQIAKALGVSRAWVNRMENGTENCDRLIEYWEV